MIDSHRNEYNKALGVELWDDVRTSPYDLCA